MLEAKIFIDDSDIYKAEQMVDYVVRFLLQHKIKGATVFGGRIGFGKHHHLYNPGLIGSTDSIPLMVLFIDEDDKVKSLLPELKNIISDSLIVFNKTEEFIS